MLSSLDTSPQGQFSLGQLRSDSPLHLCHPLSALPQKNVGCPTGELLERSHSSGCDLCPLEPHTHTHTHMPHTYIRTCYTCIHMCHIHSHAKHTCTHATHVHAHMHTHATYIHMSHMPTTYTHATHACACATYVHMSHMPHVCAHMPHAHVPHTCHAHMPCTHTHMRCKVAPIISAAL